MYTFWSGKARVKGRIVRCSKKIKLQVETSMKLLRWERKYFAQQRLGKEALLIKIENLEKLEKGGLDRGGAEEVM